MELPAVLVGDGGNFTTALAQRAGTERTLGGWPAPMVKAISQLVQLNSKTT
jgi:hypothetical protein